MGSLPPVSLEPGYRLDRYELLCKIGQGGMASVWLARTQGKHGFERLVAVKTVLPEHATDAGFRTMLLDEARIAAAIDHPNVARILDVGEDRDVPFLVLEYVAGDSLNRLHRKLAEDDRRIPPELVLRILSDTCAGLHVAHELVGADGTPLGIVHRDISPQNILLSELGIAKLIDFGVAKAAGRLSAETATGIIKGKVAYMAPEQALGLPVDRRADVWAVGAVAYYLLAGKPPFDGANDAARLIRAVSGERPDPLPTSVPAPIAEVVLRALSREARDRFETAAELRRAMEDAAVSTSLTATPEDVARFCAEHLGEAVRARKKMLERALRAANDRAHARAVLSGDGAAAADGSGSDLRPAPREEETSAGTIAHGVAVVEAVPRPARRWVVPAAAAGVLALVGAAFAVGSLTARAPAPVVPAAPPPEVESARSAADAPSATIEPVASAGPALSASASAAPPKAAAKPPARVPSKATSSPVKTGPSQPPKKTSDDTIF